MASFGLWAFECPFGIADHCQLHSRRDWWEQTLAKAHHKADDSCNRLDDVDLQSWTALASTCSMI